MPWRPAEPLPRPVQGRAIGQAAALLDHLQPVATLPGFMVKPSADVVARDFYGEAAMCAKPQLLRT
jgi:hypothetical protein